jgi:hypothetical protein
LGKQVFYLEASLPFSAKIVKYFSTEIPREELDKQQNNKKKKKKKESGKN